MKGKGRGKGSKGLKRQDRPELWDAVERFTLQSTMQPRCWECSAVPDTVDPIGKPSGQTHERGRQDSSTTERCRQRTHREEEIWDRHTSKYLRLFWWQGTVWFI